MREAVADQDPDVGERAAAEADIPATLSHGPRTEKTTTTMVQDGPQVAGVQVGAPSPLGAHPMGDGVNFALFSRHATRVRLELFDRPEDAEPARVIDLEPSRNRTGDVWHVWVPGVAHGQLYGYRVDGPYAPDHGHRFNFNRLLLDPFATAISPPPAWDYAAERGYDPSASLPDLSISRTDDSRSTPKCVFTNQEFDWGEDAPPRVPWSKTVIYEVHVRGFTFHPSSGVDHPGTYRGILEKVPYLRSLGVTTVELMPVLEFNDTCVVRKKDHPGRPVRDFWGYNPVTFFAPNAAYSSSGRTGQQEPEFKQMVKGLHEAGIEVVLDVVFNHTSEGDELGPTFCFRGVDNSVFYILGDDKRYYKDYTGTGNTISANEPAVQDQILAALRHWVVDMHVDGFRFDLAAALARGPSGPLLSDPPLLERITTDPVLKGAKLIAEAWDAAGAHEVGRFAALGWASWNDRFRDDVRRFWRGDDGMLGPFASRICGSSDIFSWTGRGPESGINFVTCHDGFTLNDLVTYGRKHNEANGEGNLDGTDANYSHNLGWEGESDDAGIEEVRKRQIKNMILTLFIARGAPMLLAGDEFRRTQRGNNNAYCQDNEIGWVDWRNLELHKEIFRFAKGMIAFRSANPVLGEERFYEAGEISWFDPRQGIPDWNDPKERNLGLLVQEGARGDAIFMMFNAGTTATDFPLPPSPPEHEGWRVAADTFREPPGDISPPGDEEEKEATAGPEGPGSYRLAAMSSAILVARCPRMPRERGRPGPAA
jgi:isoamylase